jgi:SulP family sulfate permease
MLAAALRMIKLASMAALVRTGRADAVVIAATAVLTVAVNLITAVIAGVTLAAIVALAAITATMRLESESSPGSIPSRRTASSPPAHGEPGRHHKGDPFPAGDPIEQPAQSPPQPVAVYRLAGPLFFAATQTLRDRLATIAPPRVVILRMAGITTLDATGAHALGEAITDLEHQGSTVILTELHPHHDQTLTTLGIAGDLRTAGHIQPTLHQALGRAIALLDDLASNIRQGPAHLPAQSQRSDVAPTSPVRHEWPI